MDAELRDKPGLRKKTGLVDRLYADNGLESEPSDSDIPESEIYGKYVLGSKPKDPYAQEVGPGAGVMKGIESWLGENVTEPLAKAGYPKIGAAASAIPATIADAVIPQTAGDYAGALIPFGKVGKALKAEEKIGSVLSKEEMAAKRAADNASVLREMKNEKFRSPASNIRSEEEIPLTAREKFEQRTGAKKPAIDAWDENQDATERALAKFEPKDADKYRQLIQSEGARTSEPYIGHDIANPQYHDNPFKSLPQPFPNSQVGDVQGHIGKELDKGGADPFAWMESKYGVSKKVLEDHADKPLKISTRSDLIAHSDYLSKLNPDLHQVEMHMTGNDSRVNRVLTPGAPSYDRQIKAIKILQDRGIPVTIVHDKIRGLPPEMNNINELELARAGVRVPIKTNDIKPSKNLWKAIGNPDTFTPVKTK